MNGNNQPAVATSSQKWQGCQWQHNEQALTATSMSNDNFQAKHYRGNWNTVAEQG